MNFKLYEWQLIIFNCFMLQKALNSSLGKGSFWRIIIRCSRKKLKPPRVEHDQNLISALKSTEAFAAARLVNFLTKDKHSSHAKCELEVSDDQTCLEPSSLLVGNFRSFNWIFNFETATGNSFHYQQPNRFPADGPEWISSFFCSSNRNGFSVTRSFIR